MPDDTFILGLMIGGAIVIIGGIVWFVIVGGGLPLPQPVAKGFENVESWDVSYNEEGDISKIIVHRDVNKKL